MPKQPTTEFWRSLQPIASSMKPDASPEIFHACAPVDDDKYYVPFSETVDSRPLWISIKDNMWAGILRAKSAGLVNRHYHPHEGPLIWLDGDGNPDGYFDVHDYVAMCRKHFEEVGISAGYVNTLLR